MIDKYLIFFM